MGGNDQQHMTYDTLHLFMEHKLSQNAEKKLAKL